MSKSQKPRPEPKIRRHNKTPYRKATNAEIESRIKWLADKMVTDATLTKFQIHDIMHRRYGLHWRTTDDVYIVRAKKLLQERASMSREDGRKFGVNLLLEMIKKGKNVNACEKRLAEILGYNAPQQHRLGDPQGRPLAPAVVAPTVNFIMPTATKRQPENGTVSPEPARSGHSNGVSGNGH